MVTATLLAGCAGGPQPSTAPTSTRTSSETTSPPATASPTGALTASPSATASTASPTTCEPFGTTTAGASSADWSSQLRTGPAEALWGVTMRVATHPCYDRWVFEFAGTAAMPGWSVTPHDGPTFLADASGEAVSPPLAGTASLDVAFAAWYDGTVIDHDPYAGPKRIGGGAGHVIAEARILGAFEGITHVGIGLDAARPYRVTWLTNPARLVIDVYTG